MIILPTKDLTADGNQIDIVARASLVWPNAHKHPSAIVFGPQTFVAPLSIAGMSTNGVNRLCSIIESGNYGALWHHGHVTINYTE